MPLSMIKEQQEQQQQQLQQLQQSSQESGLFIDSNHSEAVNLYQNSPKFLASSQSGIRLPPLTEGGIQQSSELQSSTSSSTSSCSINNSPKLVHQGSAGSFIASPKSPNNKVLGFFTKSTSYQSLLSNALQNSHIQNSSPPLVSQNNGSVDSPPTIRSSPSQKRLARNEKAKSSPPLSPIPFPHDGEDILSTSFNSSKNNSNNEMFSLLSSKESKGSLIPLVLDKIQGSYVDSDSTTTSILSNGSSNSAGNTEQSSPNTSPRTPIGRARSNSKNIQYSPNTSSCKIPPPQSPQSPQSQNTPPTEVNVTPESVNNFQNITPQNNNNNSQLKNISNNLPTSPPIPISNNINNNNNNILKTSGKLKNNDINILHINNNYVCPSPSPSNMHSHYPPVSIVDFTLIEKIGEGGFGQVFLAKKNDTKEIVALKRMSKDLIWSKNKVSHIKNERDILAQGRNHRWIVSLNYSFQDDNYLYLAMEYVPGGDLRSLLSALNSLGEDNARFYMAEMIEAVDSCHRLGYCHRDLKPENFLIDKTGHIKLADFGLSKNVVTRYSVNKTSLKNTPNSNAAIEHTPMKFSLNTSVTDFGSFKDLNNQAQLAYSVVGSPFYMAPEVLQATTGYGDEVDWWSLGCMFYEFIFGYPPFDGDSPEEVMETVLKWKTILQRPEGISDMLWDLISRLICDGSTRLGSGEKGVENIKSHPFFQGVNWGNLHSSEPPFVPVLENEFDTTYFENTEKLLDTNDHLLVGDKLRSPVVYTNKNSGGFITSKSKQQNRNILGFTYPRAQDDPMFLTNLLHNFHSSNEDVHTNDSASSKSSLTPPYTSPYNSSENINFSFKQEPHSPYNSYKN
ncbi:putative protein serine/threonine kinase [Tieghemostelium lacteum]|uniref:non-specific serine/threonine protein kinase n=1 Tax=Tieghemostelium lacteum TaxID=361077 RepID=A0A151ZSD3_TIELA|nr:putative protein serine/threonine kinase [Tieghemostelium lacteum]|eukprot:KYQ96839.1 putative protein serine/threonine kinase [Tieghemostelium lacteum]